MRITDKDLRVLSHNVVIRAIQFQLDHVGIPESTREKLQEFVDVAGNMKLNRANVRLYGLDHGNNHAGKSVKLGRY